MDINVIATAIGYILAALVTLYNKLSTLLLQRKVDPVVWTETKSLKRQVNLFVRDNVHTLPTSEAKHKLRIANEALERVFSGRSE